MNRPLLHGVSAAALLLAACLAAPAKGPAPRTGGQGFIILGETRPVLVRAHVEVNGKALEANWERLLNDLFAYLDVNGDGTLSKEEAARIPSVEQLLVGGIDLGGGRRRRARSAKADGKKADGKKADAKKADAKKTDAKKADAKKPDDELEDFDSDKDGKVSRAELAAYYRKNGLTPFGFQLAADDVDAVTMAFLNGPNPEPSLEEVTKTTFALLDSNGDGRLTAAELAAASALLDRDENDDEILTPRELVYSKGKAPSASNPVMAALVQKGKAVLSSSAKVVMPVDASGVSNELARVLQERYGASKKGPAKEKKLDRKDLSLDEAAFRQLDRSGDGVLDAGELAGFGKRAPDVELVLRMGASDGPAVEVIAPREKPALGGLRQTPETALFELGLTWVELRSSAEGYSNNTLSEIIQQQLVAQLEQADSDGDGIITEKESKKGQLRDLFKLLDRDGDGKVTRKDLIDYLKQYRRLQTRALSGCVSLALADQSRGLFDQLDSNRDGKLSVRELRQADRLLEALDRDRKGYLTTADVPRSYQLKLRRGPAQLGGLRQLSVFERLYGGSEGAEEAGPGRGPAWFRKMDRNRDGDVSRREFLFGPEQFRKIDADGDGLISVEEAEKAGAVQPEKSASGRTR